MTNSGSEYRLVQPFGLGVLGTVCGRQQHPQPAWGARDASTTEKEGIKNGLCCCCCCCSCTHPIPMKNGLNPSRLISCEINCRQGSLCQWTGGMFYQYFPPALLCSLPAEFVLCPRRRNVFPWGTRSQQRRFRREKGGNVGWL